VNAVRSVLEELDFNIPVYGMVKDDNHRTRGLVTGEREFDLSKDIVLLRFVTAIQDEAHRFALEYNRKLRAKRYSGSVLDNIEGVGPKRKKELIRHFGSVKAIKEAEPGEIAKVKGISRDLAQKYMIISDNRSKVDGSICNFRPAFAYGIDKPMDILGKMVQLYAENKG